MIHELNSKAIAVEAKKGIVKIVWETGNEGEVLWMFHKNDVISKHQRIRLPKGS